MEPARPLSKGRTKVGAGTERTQLACSRLKARPESLPALTGLRFVAALAVFIEHAREAFGIPVDGLQMLGGVAVGFFFVLSGFILTYVYGSHFAREDVPRFWLARWARIWPLHVVCLALAMLLQPSHHVPQDGHAWAVLASHVALLQSWAIDGEWTLALNGPAWSISVELFFYVSFPFLARLGTRAFSRFYAMLLALTAGFIVWGDQWAAGDAARVQAFDHIAHFWPIVRLAEFSTGLALARVFRSGFAEGLFRRGFAALLGLELLAVAAVGFTWHLIGPSAGLYPVLDLSQHAVLARYLQAGAGFALPFAFVVWIAARSQGPLARLLGTRTFQWLGETSFAFYLVHRIIIANVAESTSGLGLGWEERSVVALAISLAASGLLFALVETPCRKWLLSIGRKPAGGPRAARREWLTRSALVLVIVGSSVHLQRSGERRIAGLAERALAEVPADVVGAVFEGEGELLGLSRRRTDAGLELAILWKAAAAASRAPFIHLCAADESIVGYVEPLLHDVELQDAGRVRLATVTVSETQLEPCTSIGFGFYSAARESAQIDRGPRSMGGHRLDLATAPFDAPK